MRHVAISLSGALVLALLAACGGGGGGGDSDDSGGGGGDDPPIVPSGPQVAYVANQDSSAMFELYGSNLSGGANRKLNGPLIPGGSVASATSLPAFAWSPRATHIAYTALQDSPGVFELYVSAWMARGTSS